MQYTSSVGCVFFGNYKAPRALHAYNWYEIMQLPDELMPLTLAYSTLVAGEDKTMIANITNSGMVRINPIGNEVAQGEGIYGSIPYVLA